MVIILAAAVMAGFRAQAEKERTAEQQVLDNWMCAGGVWKETDTEIQADNRKVGDAFYLSDLHIDGSTSFIYECDVIFKGRAVGIIFGAADREKPSAAWYCLNVEPGSNISRAFFVRGGLVWNVSRPLESEEQTSKPHHLKVVFLAGNELIFYLNEKQVGSYSTADFAGGYLGLMTCEADAVFSNVRYTEFTAPEIEQITFLNLDFEQEYAPERTEYSAYADYTKDVLRFQVLFGDALTVTVGEQHIKSGETVSVPLQVGYNEIPIQIHWIMENLQVDMVKYLLVHRDQDPALLYHEIYRPQLHYSSRSEWINDPNGLVYNAATGEYHLFYQTRPRTSVLSPNTSWYHAVSKDLVHWEQIEPALLPDDLGLCWSGSGGVDYQNTSGLFDPASDPAGRLVLIYSSVYGDTFYGTEKLSLAYSQDNGRTWIKYEGNPIIKNGSNYVQKYNDGFRDPKLVWYADDSYEAGGIWILMVGGGQGRIFSSPDLLNWRFESAITGLNQEKLSGECPDFFPIEVEGKPGNVKWVYIGGHVQVEQNIFQTYAVVGSFEKNEKGTFVFTGEQEKQVLFGGNTMYASQTFFNDSSNRRIQISWLREWTAVQPDTANGEDDRFSKDWNGLMSWPLELKLHNQDGKYVLTCYPVEEMAALQEEVLFETEVRSVSPEDGNLLAGVSGSYYEILADIHPGTASEFGFRLRKGDERATVITYHTDTGLLTADGIQSGKYGGTAADVTLLPGENGRIMLRIIIDSNIVDVFGNDGAQSVFALTYPLPEYTEMEFFVTGGDVFVESMKIQRLASIWGEPDLPAARKNQSAVLERMLWGLAGGFVLLLFAAGSTLWLLRKKKKR